MARRQGATIDSAHLTLLHASTSQEYFVVPAPCLRPRETITSLREIKHNLLVLSRLTSVRELRGQRVPQIGGVH